MFPLGNNDKALCISRCKQNKTFCMYGCIRCTMYVPMFLANHRYLHCPRLTLCPRLWTLKVAFAFKPCPCFWTRRQSLAHAAERPGCCAPLAAWSHHILADVQKITWLRWKSLSVRCYVNNAKRIVQRTVGVRTVEVIDRSAICTQYLGMAG